MTPANATLAPSDTFDATLLVEAWESGIDAFATVAESLTSTQWLSASPLPCWSMGDIVAHVVGIERDLLGDPLPVLELDWSQYPHANDLFSRYTEMGVITRRGIPSQEVCAELRKSIVQRRECLQGGNLDLAQIVRGPGGWELPLGVSLRMRCFDIWVHTLDICQAINAPGPLGNPAATVAAAQIRKGVARNLGKALAARTATGAVSINFDITGPGVSFHQALHIDESGWASWQPASDLANVDLSTGWLNFAALACGRGYAQRAIVHIAGDAELADVVMANLNMAP